MSLYCRATLNFVGDADRVAVATPILDARSSAPVGFDRCGFTLLQHASEVTDWRDEHRVAEVHRPEIVELASSFTGCDAVVAYPPIVRSPATARTVEDYAPIELVHSDFTIDYRAMVTDPTRPYSGFISPLLAELGFGQSDLAKASRLAMIQFWRNTGPQTPDYPLAVCDVATMDPRRQVTSVVDSYGGQHLEFEVSFFLAPALDVDPEVGRDVWYTYPAMTSDEVLVFRTYDSDRELAKQPVWTPHSAFLDPNASHGAHNRRESVEMRALCVWFG